MKLLRDVGDGVLLQVHDENDEVEEDLGECSIDTDHDDNARMSSCLTPSPSGISPGPLSPLRAWSPESVPSLDGSAVSPYSNSSSSSPVPPSLLSLSPLAPPPPLLGRSLFDDTDDDDCCTFNNSIIGVGGGSVVVVPIPPLPIRARPLPPAPSPPPPPPPCIVTDSPPSFIPSASCNFTPPWMCVFDLDDEDGEAGASYGSGPPPGCHDVYSNGLLPFVINWFSNKDDSRGGEENAEALRGHGGMMTGKEGACQTSLGGRSSSRGGDQQLEGRGVDGVKCATVSKKSSTTFLYAAPSEHSFETIFIPQQQQQQQQQQPPPPAEDDKGARGRRTPGPQGSMSVPPGVAASIAANQAKGVAEASKQAAAAGAGGSKPNSMRGGQVAADLEQVKVQTPGADRSALKDLPPLRDAPPTKREELFVMKLKLCSVIFSFDDPIADKRGKDMKRQTLLELVDYVNTPAGQKIFTESVMGDLMAMVSANVCRALPPATDDFDPEEDEPVLEPAWPHLQVAYEFFLRFIVSSEVNAKAAKKYVDQKFCLQLVELFDSEDPRERDYLKTILHRIYGKFMSHRSFIRRAISNVFYRFVYETERHNGIGELLEILGSIINGFAIPLKKEHLQFLVRALIPLHKPKCVALYHQQLSYCIIQYVEKDADTATPILNGFFKCWPWSCSGKQVMFLNELEEILELLGADQLAQVSTMLFTNLARCLDSDHFQVVERALFLWNNEHLVNSGCLSRLNAQTVLPIIYGPLYKNSSGHWNATVEGLAQNVLKMYMEYDLALYDKCTAAYFREEEEAKKKVEALNEKWNAIEQMAMAKRPALMAK